MRPGESQKEVEHIYEQHISTDSTWLINSFTRRFFRTYTLAISDLGSFHFSLLFSARFFCLN